MKRVLFVTNFASPYRIHFFDLLGKELDVTVLLSDTAEDACHRDSGWFEAGMGGFHLVQLRQTAPIGEERLCLEVLSWLKKPYDQIVVCGYSSPTNVLAMAYLRHKGIPFWMEVDGGLIRQEGRMKYALKKRLVTMADRWLSSGAHTSAYLTHYGARADRIWEYPFSSLYQEDILEEVVSPEEKKALRRELGMAEEQIVLSVGRFIPVKGFDTLLAAAQDLPEGVGVYIVGDEAPQAYLEEKEKRGLRHVHFLGFHRKEALAKLYRAADLFVLPTRSDVWGLVINEAMAYGLPVVTTNRCVAGLELVEDGVNGYLVSPDDPEALAEKVLQVLAADREKMGRASLEKICPYTLENMARTHVEIFERLAPREGQGPSQEAGEP